MALIRTVRGKTPQWGENCFLAENATITGDVIMGQECSIWFQAVIRGDVNSILMGDRVNVQDGAIIHCTYERTKTVIGDEVSIGHQAIVHGCTIHPLVLVGMGSRIMDYAVVETGCIIAAGAVVLEHMVCEAGYIYAGVPARKIKPVSKELLEGEIRRIAHNYVKYASWYK
ncbi:MAG TPA: gamma carbonic anhydrase family protein [Membranihabitans sp.]|nr:gamma carbonic anhydrase family protein [Membranihabitans sp.]